MEIRMRLVQLPYLLALSLAIVPALAGCQAKKASSSAKAESPVIASGAPAANSVAKAAPLPELKQKIFLVVEYRNAEPEYVHSAWFMDTAGNEYRFVAKQASDDLLSKIIDDSQLNAEEIQQLVAASKPLPRRVSEQALARALSTLSAVTQEPVEPVTQNPCSELGNTYLFAYVLEPRLGVLGARFLRGEQCAQVTSRNPSQGAMELADWLEKLGRPKLLPI
jgi:hypothetical protein